MPEKLYRVFSLHTFHGIRFTNAQRNQTIDMIVREIGGSKRYRELSLAIIGSDFGDDLIRMTCADELDLPEGIHFGIYYDGGQTGSGQKNINARVYVISPRDYPYDIVSYENDIRNPDIRVPFSKLSEKSDYVLLTNWFTARGKKVP
jgi:hypothetical protein